KFLRQLKWVDKAKDNRDTVLSLQEVDTLITEGRDLGIPDTNEQMAFYKAQKDMGELWESKAKELISAEVIHFQQLDALAAQAKSLPVTNETFLQVEHILNKQRQMHMQIMAFYERTRAEKLEDRPKYKEVKELM